MLTELKVSQFAIIDHIHVEFKSGLNILSGETGAGKSILIKSLALLMGAKSSTQDIRTNEEQALIEGGFDLSQRPDIQTRLEDMGIQTDNQELIVRRILQRSGKGKIYLNGQLSSLQDLRQIVFPLVTIGNPTDAPLIEITGQHENKDLMSSRYQMDTLDQYCGNGQIRDEVLHLFEDIQALKQGLLDLESLSQQREQQIDFLEFQIKEIRDLDPKPNEDDILREKIRQLKDQDKRASWIQGSLERLNDEEGAVLPSLRALLSSFPESSHLAPAKKQLQEAIVLLEDLSYDIQRAQNTSSSEDENLEDLEERLNRIRKLQKKFGDNIEMILASLQEMEDKHQKLVNIAESLEKNRREILKKEASLKEKSLLLRKKRLEGALLLAKEVNRELADLNMKGLEFLIELEDLAAPNSTGMDVVVFRTRAGARDEARDLARFASGGELSRILLSLKQVIGANQFPRTFLFDEVDTGVSGPTAQKVGAKLKNLSRYQQVICVTHLPQVASFADHHYFIEKTAQKNRVEMLVTELKKEERVQEIARLISGEKLTKTSLQHARELLKEI